MHPIARRDHLTTAQIDNDLVIFDEVTSEAHYLPPTTKRVWDGADGSRDVQGLLALLRQDDPSVTEDTVRVALDALSEAGLLEEQADPVADQARISRRSLLQKAALTSLAISSLPLSPLYAQSVPDGGLREDDEVARKLKTPPRRSDHGLQAWREADNIREEH